MGSVDLADALLVSGIFVLGGLVKGVAGFGLPTLGLGLLVPTAGLPGILSGVAAALPSGALGDAMRIALVDGGWPLAQWAVLAVWGAVAGFLTSRTFRWSD